MRGVYIDNRSFEELIKAFDSPDTLFYLDPPYWVEGKTFYQHEFKPEDHTRLRDILSVIKGQFVLSYNQSKKVRKLYRDFKVRTTASVHYSMNNKCPTARKIPELLITNF